ncbi:MAG TPA: endonuclease/exonuclease/phosphatase family protein [Candidatus Nanopelagicales bacterium]|nr:endonuclease/exonuclease/phosphatase family protein [Candidatus Nanopelagicales bacterium]
MTVRLATYNLLHGMPVLGGVPESVRDAGGRPVGPPRVDDEPLRQAIAALDADVIGLQEVDVHQPRSDYAHQVRVVADVLDADHWHFSPSVAGTPGEHGWRPADERLDHVSAGPAARPDQRSSASLEVERMGPLYGVGLVSRLPVLEWRSTRFDAAPWTLPLLVPAQPRPRFIRVPDEPRSAIAAVVQGSRGPFTVATAHLSFVPGYNVRQLKALRRWLHGLPRPLVLLGDFNLPGRIPGRVTGFVELVREPTYPVLRPRVQLDHVLADGLTAHEQATAEAAVHLLPVSDHAAVSVDLDL